MSVASDSASRDKQSGAVLIACVLASIGIVWSLWRVPFALTNDGPQSLLLAYIDAHYDDPGSIFPLQFTRGLGLSGRGFMFLYAPLESLAWPNGVRVAQAVMQLGFGWGGAVLARAVSGRFSYKSLFAFLLAASWPFYMGFWAYTVASALGLWLLAAVVWVRQPTRVVKLALSVGFFAELLCHPMMGTVTLVAASLVVLARHWPLPQADRPRLRGDLVWLALSFLPVVLVFVVMQTGRSEMAKVIASETTSWETPGRLFASLPRLVVPGSSALGWVVLAIAVAGLVFGLRGLRREAAAERRGLTIAALGLVTLSLAGPLNLPGWQYFAPRFMPTALVLAATLLPDLDARRARLGALGVASVLAGVTISNAGSLNASLASACGDALFALDQPRARTGMVLPIIFDSQCGLPADPGLAPVPYMAPQLHMSALFPMRHGGGTPFVFSGTPAVHVLVPRETTLPTPPLELWGFTHEDAAMREPRSRAAILDRFVIYGTAYEALQVFGKNDADTQQLIDRGMIVDLDHGTFLSGRLEPCTLAVVVPVEPGEPPMQVTGGVRSPELWVGAWAPAESDKQRRAMFRTVCGQQWVSVTWADGVQRCKNADPEGRIHVSVPALERGLEVRCER